MVVTTRGGARPELERRTVPPPDPRLTLTREQADLLQRILRLYRFGLPDLT